MNYWLSFQLRVDLQRGRLQPLAHRRVPRWTTTSCGSFAPIAGSPTTGRGRLQHCNSPVSIICEPYSFTFSFSYPVNCGALLPRQKSNTIVIFCIPYSALPAPFDNPACGMQPAAPPPVHRFRTAQSYICRDVIMSPLPVASRTIRRHPCVEEVDNRVNFRNLLGISLWITCVKRWTTPAPRRRESHSTPHYPTTDPCAVHRSTHSYSRRGVVPRHVPEFLPHRVPTHAAC